MQIADLQPSDAAAIEQAAHALVAGFRDHAPDAWPDLAAARAEVHEALEPGKVCRVARDADGTVLGWVGDAYSMRGSGSCAPWLFSSPPNNAALGAPWLPIWRCRYGNAADSPCCLAAMTKTT